MIGCAAPVDDHADNVWTGSVDTLNGRTVVHNPQDGVWQAGQEWRLVPELRIGEVDGTEPEVFGRITAFAISTNGDIAVLDGHAAEVRVFDAGGRHVRTLGRRGEGPGEFGSPLALHYDSNARLWVADVGNARYTAFAPDGSVVTMIRRVAGAALGAAGIMTAADQFIDVTPADFSGSLVPLRLNTRDGTLDTLPTIQTVSLPPTPVPVALAPFMSRAVFTFDRQGRTWLAWSDEFTIFRRSSGGDTSLVIRRNMPSPALTESQRDSLRSIVAEWPFPVDENQLGIGAQQVRSLHVDHSGHLFVQPAVEDPLKEGRVFQVFDTVGRYLGTIDSPIKFESRPAPVFTDGFVYGVSIGELDVQYVVRARIVTDPSVVGEHHSGARGWVKLPSTAGDGRPLVTSDGTGSSSRSAVAES